MARVRDASPTRRRLFDWAIEVGKQHFHAQTPGPWLRVRHRVADRLVLAPLRKRLTGGRLRFFISGRAGLAPAREELFRSHGAPTLHGRGRTHTPPGAGPNTLRQHKSLPAGEPFPGVQVNIA